MKKIEVKSIHLDTTRDTDKYAHKKIAKLNAFIPRLARKVATAEVRLSQLNTNNKKRYSAEVVLDLPGQILEAKETTVNIYAAIDIVEAKLRNQLRKYKATRSARAGRKDVLARQFLGKITRKKRPV